MQDKLASAKDKLKGLHDYLGGILDKMGNTEANTVTSNVEIVEVPIADDVSPDLANTSVVANTNPPVVANTNPPVVTNTHSKPCHDVDNDGIEDQTPEQLERYINDALDDIKKIFRW